MAVKFAADSCITPRGRLNPAALWPKSLDLYPDGYDKAAVQEKLDSWLKEGRVKASSIMDPDPDTQAELIEEAARVWVYYRAWSEKYEALVVLPATVDVEREGGKSHLVTQIQLAGERAQEFLEEFEGLVPTVEEGVVEGFPTGPQSESVPTYYVL